MYKFKHTKYGDLTDKISYDIDVNSFNIESLEGSPKEVIGLFNVSYNFLENLKYSPLKIEGDFYCNNNKLETLKGSPKIVRGDYSCSYNNLLTLEDCTKIIEGEFNCINNKDLKNIKNQIIKYQIKAEYYITDEGDFKFEEIKEKFEKFGNYLSKKENKKQQIIKKNKEIDFGLSI